MQDFGFLLINKPVGLTSFQIVKKIRAITNIKKIGHTGTLDPFASGLLPICVGKATRLAQFLLSDKKEYRVKAKFGMQTDTGDITGKTVQEKEFKPIEETEFLEKIPQILNIKEQIPPKYSAININGKRAYELARNNVEFSIPTRNIKIFSFELSTLNLPFFEYVTTVSKGTYIRTLSEQIASLFGEIAVTTELLRSKIGALVIQNSVEISELTRENWRSFLVPVEQVLTNFPTITLNSEKSQDFIFGKRFYYEFTNQEFVNIVSENTDYLGLAEIKEKIIHPRIVLGRYVLRVSK
ncbi:MAG: tRNA pseudouridine(55) synthase TruB [Candidatus Cloacimonetes bacterium]|nr:tRNA pseudouridine(55) synthase TruB [Candidatus Cloacimonadota bacterium]